MHNAALWRNLKCVREYLLERTSLKSLEKCPGDRYIKMDSAAYQKWYHLNRARLPAYLLYIPNQCFHNTVRLTYFTISCLSAVHNKRLGNVQNVEWLQQLFCFVLLSLKTKLVPSEISVRASHTV